jgi:two-component system, OmpR family, sensor histidine kinase KdpD
MAATTRLKRAACFRAWLCTTVLYDGACSGAADHGGSVGKTSDEWLSEVSPEKSTGTFKLFLGYAPGVGKTYSMLSEAIRRASRGEDVVIGVIETHGRKGVAELAAKLDRIPLRHLEFRGTVFEEMDVDAILARKPSVVLVDELAHTNIEGSKHHKRFEDVVELLEAKIDILSTMNVQHIESLGPTVLQITGVQIRETVPDWVMQRVDEIHLADLTPQALQQRMSRGDIYPVERAERALAHFFRPANLIALRELALLQVTQVVDRSLDTYFRRDGGPAAQGVIERIGVCINAKPAAQYLIARGSRMAQGLGGDLYVLYMDLGRALDSDQWKNLEENLRFAENLNAHVVRAAGTHLIEGIRVFIREHHITQVILGRSARSGWRWLQYLLALQGLLRACPTVDLHIVTQEPRK